MNRIPTEEWISKQNLAELAGLSERQIENLQKEFSAVESLHYRSRIKGKKVYHYTVLKKITRGTMVNFYEECVERENRVRLVEKIPSENSTKEVACPKNKEEHVILAEHFRRIGWDYFITISPKMIMNEDTCRRKMESFFRELENNFPHLEHGVLFASERFAERKGSHIHFVLKSNLSENQIEKALKRYIPSNNIETPKFDPSLKGDEYCLKEGVRGLNYDFHLTEGLKKLFN